MQIVEWFAITHVLRQDAWVPVALPAAGGFEDQDAWLLAGIAYARMAANDLIRERVRLATAIQSTPTAPPAVRTDG